MRSVASMSSMTHQMLMVQLSVWSQQNRSKRSQDLSDRVVSDGNGLIRYCRTMDGNHADSVWNMEALTVLQEIFGEEFRNHTYIADSKLLNRPNLEVLNRQGSEVRFISHIPANFAGKIADKYRSIARERNQWVDLGQCCTEEETPDKRAIYRSQRFEVDIYGLPYTLIVYETSAADERVKSQIKTDTTDLETLNQG